GWKGGEKGTLYYTEDGGVSWSLKYHPEEITIKSIHMVDENTLWLVGNSGEVSYTRNKGITWNTQIYPYANRIEKIYFFDSHL
ncbi:MAG: WD40/YVTN/BNR-like repeat-containing protein, partial [Flavobacteriaceae bacterium]